MSDFDYDLIDSDAIDHLEETYPRLTWWPGNPALEELGEGNINYTGGLTWSSPPTGLEIPGWNLGQYKLKGEVISSLGARTAQIAVIHCKKWWDKCDKSKDEHSHFKIIGFIKGYTEPVTIEFRGNASRNFESAFYEHIQVLVAEAQKTAPQGVKVPYYALWLTITAGKHEPTGKTQQKECALPQIWLPKVINRDYALTQKVDREEFIKFREFWKQTKTWAEEQERQIIEDVPNFANEEHKEAFKAQVPDQAYQEERHDAFQDKTEQPHVEEVFPEQTLKTAPPPSSDKAIAQLHDTLATLISDFKIKRPPILEKIRNLTGVTLHGLDRDHLRSLSNADTAKVQSYASHRLQELSTAPKRDAASVRA